MFVTVSFKVQSLGPREPLVAKVRRWLEEKFAAPLSPGHTATATVVSVVECPATQPLAVGQVVLVSPASTVTAAVGPFPDAIVAEAAGFAGSRLVPLYPPNVLTSRREYDFLDSRVTELLQQFLETPLSAERKRDLLCSEVGTEVAELLMVADSFEDCVEWLQQRCGKETTVTVLSRLVEQASEEASQEE